MRILEGDGVTYDVGIDLGTTYTAAAVHRDGRSAIFSLGSRTAAMPSVVLLRQDETVLTGEAAVRRAMTEPERVAREFKRRLGDTTPLIVGGSPYSAEALMARLLQSVLSQVQEREGGAPSRVGISHPANWGQYKLDLLHQAVRMAGIDEHIVTYLTEPEAAALSYAAQERVEPGEVVAVYDLGGGTFDAAILRRTAAGFEIIGKPEGIERLGGIDFDAAVFAHVVRSLDGVVESLDPNDPSSITAMARLRQDCVDAKEALSSDTDATIPVLLPGVQTEVRITRAEFEALIRPSLVDSIDAMHRAVRSAGVESGHVSKVLLVGGSSRVPLIAQMVSSELGRPVAVDADPKHSVALGAAFAASEPSSVVAPVVPPAADGGPAAPPPTTAAAPIAAATAVSAVASPAPDPEPAPVSTEPVSPEPVSPEPLVAEPAATAPPAADTPTEAIPVVVDPEVTQAMPVISGAAATQSVAAVAPPAVTEAVPVVSDPGGSGGGAAPPPSTDGQGGSRAILIGALVAVAALAAIGGFLLSRGGDDAEAAGDTTVPDSTTSTTAATTTSTTASTTTTELPPVPGSDEATISILAAIDADVSPIELTFDERTVTLSGRVFDEEARQALLDAAAQIPGMLDVVDNMELQTPDEQCTEKVRIQPSWACVTLAEFDGTTVHATYLSSMDFDGPAFSINSGLHLHVFGSNVAPETAGTAGPFSDGTGAWQVWDTPKVIDVTLSEIGSGSGVPEKLCVRIANQIHTLESLENGNCWPIEIVEPVG